MSISDAKLVTDEFGMSQRNFIAKRLAGTVVWLVTFTGTSRLLVIKHK